MGRPPAPREAPRSDAQAHVYSSSINPFFFFFFFGGGVVVVVVLIVVYSSCVIFVNPNSKKERHFGRAISNLAITTAASQFGSSPRAQPPTPPAKAHTPSVGVHFCDVGGRRGHRGRVQVVAILANGGGVVHLPSLARPIVVHFRQGSNATVGNSRLWAHVNRAVVADQVSRGDETRPMVPRAPKRRSLTSRPSRQASPETHGTHTGNEKTGRPTRRQARSKNNSHPLSATSAVEDALDAGRENLGVGRLETKEHRPKPHDTKREGGG